MRTPLHSILATAGAALLLSSLAAPVRADILYVSSYGYQAIERITSDGTVGYPWFVSGLNYPGGLAFDSAGVLYVGLPGKIEKFSLAGTDLGLFANTGSSDSSALAFDRAGNLYATGNNTIMKFTPDGVGSVFADASDGLNAVGSLAFDSAENLYVSNYPVDLAGRRILKFTRDGVGSVFATASNLVWGPSALAVDSADNLYVLDSVASISSIYKFTPDGARSYFADAGGEGDRGLAFDSAGNLYYTSPFPAHIGKISPDGVPLSDFNPQPVSTSISVALTDDNGVPVPLANQRPAPEPSTLALLGLGLPALLGFSRPRRAAGPAV
jgi:sugar lactone lactonase YvrE